MPTKVTDEDRFDFQAWITNARPDVQAVTVYQNLQAVRRVEALLEQSASDDKPRTYKTAPQSAELKRAIEERDRSAVTLVIKANSDEDIRTARAAAKAAGVDPDRDEDALSVYHLAQNIVDVYPGREKPFDHDAPHRTLTASQVKSLRTAITEKQYTKLWVTLTKVANILPEPSPDFSQQSSPGPGTPTP